MKPAATKIGSLAIPARGLLGAFLITSLIACGSGGSNDNDDDPSGGGGSSASGSSSGSSSTGSSSTSSSSSTGSSGSSSSSGGSSGSGSSGSSSSSSSSSGGTSSGSSSSGSGGALVVEDVVWTGLVNATASGNTLEKTGGCDGCLDAGAESEQFTPAGNGYLEFPVTNTSLIRYIGLNPNSTTARPTEITFALKIVSGTAEVKEEGQYRADTPVAVGDVMRIEARDGVVTYARNGTVFYTSTVTMNQPFQADTALISMGAGFSDVQIAVAADDAGDSAFSLSSSKKRAASGAPPKTGDAVAWTGLVNVAASGNSLRKTGGCDGCRDAGAVSRQRLTSGDAHLDFTVSETGPELYVGLNHGDAGTGAAEFPFAIRLVNNNAEVRENGEYRAGIAVGSGDTLRIEVRAGAVSYARNGVVFYTSGATPSYPLRVDTAFISSGSTMSNARITGGGVSRGFAGSSTGTPASSSGGGNKSE